MAKLILNLGANVHKTSLEDRNKTALLALASCYRYYCEPVMQLLIDAGADVNAQDSNGYTALHHLIAMQSDLVDKLAEIKCLLDAGADPFMEYDNMENVVDMATRLNVEEAVIQLLLQQQRRRLKS